MYGIIFSILFKIQTQTKELQYIDNFVKQNDIKVINKYTNIYKVLNNIQILDDNIQIINTKFTNSLHIWYNDNAIFHEICKHLASIGIHILHEIVIWKNIENSGQTMYVIPHNYGYDNMPKTTKHHHTSYLNEEVYYNTQIKKCPNNTMAIPIIIYHNNNSIAHSNMLVIKKQKNNPVKILVEHFEPYGNASTQNNIFEITQLMYNLHSYDVNVTRQDDIQIISTSQFCSLQSHVLFSKYCDSCNIFSIWYAVKRLLNPEEDPIKTCKNMEYYLLENNPILTIKNIILSFIMLLNINEKGVINGKKIIDKKLLSQIIS